MNDEEEQMDMSDLHELLREFTSMLDDKGRGEQQLAAEIRAKIAEDLSDERVVEDLEELLYDSTGEDPSSQELTQNLRKLHGRIVSGLEAG